MDSLTIFLFHAHSGWRYLVILVVVLALGKAILGWATNARWTRIDQVLGALTPAMFNIQFLLGLILWILQARWLYPGNNIGAWEHPVTMIIALTIAQVTWTRVKRAPLDALKFRTATIGFAIAGLILALGVARITHVL